MTCLTGVPSDELLPEQDPEDEAAAQASEHQRLADFIKRHS